jgi:predicted nucleotidyltransferase
LLKTERNGRQVLYKANTEHPLFPELRSMVAKVMGIDRVIESIVQRLGNLEKAYLTGDYAEGKDTGIIDLVLVGEIDSFHLHDLTRKTERYIKRKIRTLVLSPDELETYMPELQHRAIVQIWEAKSRMPDNDS